MLSMSHLDKLGSQFKVALGLRGKGETPFGMLAETLAEGSLQFGMAYVNGRYAEPGKQALEFGGVPVDLTVGSLLQAGALFGFFGHYGNAAHIVGKAISAPYLCRQGTMMGVNHRVAKAAGTPSAKGMFGVGAPPAFYPAVAGPIAAPAAAPASVWGGV